MRLPFYAFMIDLSANGKHIVHRPWRTPIYIKCMRQKLFFYSQTIFTWYLLLFITIPTRNVSSFYVRHILEIFYAIFRFKSRGEKRIAYIPIWQTRTIHILPIFMEAHKDSAKQNGNRVAIYRRSYAKWDGGEAVESCF